MPDSKPRLSIVIACLNAERTVAACLDALRAACAEYNVEMIAVYPADAPLPERIRDEYRDVRVLFAPPGTLVPVLWAEGFRVSSGGVVAFTTGHCVVGPAWARSLLEAIDQGAAGAGGALALNGDDSGPVDWAVYFLRYSAFMPPQPAGDIDEIPGDNAAYARVVLERHAESLADGFWEVDFHRRVHADGEHLVMVPEATATFGRSFSFRTILRHRFLHGRHYGWYRAQYGLAPGWRGILAGPLVPLVLTARILRRVAERPMEWRRALASLPILLPLAGSWALGEMTGAWRACHE
jgi:GT2 family glycosyltransferase